MAHTEVGKRRPKHKDQLVHFLVWYGMRNSRAIHTVQGSSRRDLFPADHALRVVAGWNRSRIGDSRTHSDTLQNPNFMGNRSCVDFIHFHSTQQQCNRMGADAHLSLRRRFHNVTSLCIDHPAILANHPIRRQFPVHPTGKNLVWVVHISFRLFHARRLNR